MTQTIAERGPVDRFIDAVEMTAGLFLAVVTVLTFVAVILRYIFAWSIPDSYDFTRLLLGILIFWGISVASYRGDHITVDLLWGAASPGWKRFMDALGAVVTLVAMTAFTWMMATKVLGTRADHVLTFDLRQPVWIYYGIAWLGLAAAVPLLAIRAFRVLSGSSGAQRSGESRPVE